MSAGVARIDYYDDPTLAQRVLTLTFVTTMRSPRTSVNERDREGDMITTAFVESTINHVVSKRMVKRRQLQWSQREAHVLSSAVPARTDEEREAG